MNLWPKRDLDSTADLENLINHNMAMVIPSPQQGNVGSMHAPSLQPGIFAPFEPSGAQPRRIGRRTRDLDVKEVSRDQSKLTARSAPCISL